MARAKHFLMNLCGKLPEDAKPAAGRGPAVTKGFEIFRMKKPLDLLAWYVHCLRPEDLE
jgi:hypothetical protein